MNIDLRQAVIANLNNANHDMVESTILDAISSGEEKTLPGLGVLFELLWSASDDTEKNRLVDTISQQLHS